MSALRRRISRQVAVGEVRVGGGAPIVVQSMTNTDTADAAATARQADALWRAGSELVRITVNTPEAAAQVAPIRERLDAMGCSVPLVGDFHYNGHKLLAQFPDCARALAKYRINPGNVGKGAKRDEQFATMIECALRYGKPVRIGVNWGSLDPELLARMMDENASRSEPLEADAVMREVQVAQEILQTMGLRAFAPMVSACPGCGRTTSTVFQELADRIQTYLRTQMPLWRESYPGVEEMRVAVMGCVVNGPGESKHADIGISLPGTNEVPVAPVYVDGKKTVTLKGGRIAEEFQAIVENYVKHKYGPDAPARRPGKEIKIKTV